MNERNRKNMKINLQWVSTFILLISALFVGLELRQSNAIAKATARQTLNNNDISYLKSFINQEQLSIADHKIKSGDSLTNYDRHQLVAAQHVNFRIFDNAYFQYRSGLLEKEEWQKYQSIIRTLFSENEFAREMWSLYGPNFSVSFQEEVRNILDTLEP